MNKTKQNIAILTLPLNSNYGGILQAYALQQVLTEMGHSVIHLELLVNEGYSWWKIPFVFLKRVYRKYVLKDKWIIIRENYRDTICRNTKIFVSKYISRRFVTKEQLNTNLAEEYDVLLVGSDQVWRPKYIENFLHDAFLSFAKDAEVKRISYAASFGTSICEFSSEDLMVCSELLSSFAAVSVRELSGVELCRKFFGVNAVQMLDPTMLLKKEHYITLFQKTDTSVSEGDLMVYILDSSHEIKALIKDFAAYNDLRIFKTGFRYDDTDNVSIEERIPPKVEHWLRGFYNAKLVITDSFHACVFSIIFNKPFIAIGNKERGLSRFESLLSIFQLDNCLVDVSELNRISIPQIDWNQVNHILEEKRAEALSFLRTNLEC